MKINSIKIENEKIVIELDSPSASIAKLYIDSLDNNINKYSTDEDKHDYVIIDMSKVGNTITVVMLPELDTSAFTITINGILGFYYDDKELYYKQIELLTTYCNTCLDKEQKENVVVFNMRSNLLKYSLTNDLTEDAISHYKDIVRMLNIDTKGNTNGNCKNGVCTLC